MSRPPSVLVAESLGSTGHVPVATKVGGGFDEERRSERATEEVEPALQALRMEVLLEEIEARGEELMGGLVLAKLEIDVGEVEA
jgi:hypothetical protein